MLINCNEYIEIFNLVVDLFNDNSKATTWMVTDNPMLGDISPKEMLVLGRYEKLRKFVLNSYCP